jgi:hypothetical protein
MPPQKPPHMPRRLLGLLLLVSLFFAICYTQSAWAASDGVNSAAVTVQVSPLTLLLQNKVIIKVGETTCNLVYGSEPISICPDLPPGEYTVSASAEGYFVSPPSYTIEVPCASDEDAGEDSDDEDAEDQDCDDDSDHDSDEDSDHDASVSATNDLTSDFFFNLYQNNYQLYMPGVHAGQ